MESDGLKQHFIGNIISVKQSHQIKNARLMDFRVTQDQGLHFIYLLPLDERHLLIESTVFSKFLLNSTWYQNQISTYVENNLGIKEYEIIDSEQGILPMFEIDSQNKDNYIQIGAKGGATKISSGYAFSFFLKQLTSEKNNYHSYWDKWMDKIFVKYLENNSKSDEIFMKMAKKLSGKEFGSFMMGNAKFSTKLKTIFAMPKLGFLKSFFNSVLS
jgi:lycopene beta-cyclase